jgi:hypothetical protein
MCFYASDYLQAETVHQHLFCSSSYCHCIIIIHRLHRVFIIVTHQATTTTRKQHHAEQHLVGEDVSLTDVRTPLSSDSVAIV